ncbi:MAG: PEGA domain-containing protein [Nitrospirae bacterium]|nr:PEGA domain-containing protein [Nitrospirota bacterium]
MVEKGTPRRFLFLFNTAYFLIALILLNPCISSSQEVFEKVSETSDSANISALIIESNLSGSDVYIDDNKKGQTPYTIKDILPGDHIIKVTATGKKDFIRTVNLKPGEEMKVSADFQITGSISVNSDPIEGHISLDGKEMGVTPVVMKEVNVGEHTLAVIKDGYHESSQKVNIKENEVKEINIKLERITYTVKITSVPEGGQLFWNDNVKGVTPLTVDDVIPGTYKIRINKEGYNDYEDVIEIKNSGIEKTYKLTQSSGNLTLRTDPLGADIYIDGKVLGVTPTSISSLPVKQYTVKLKKEGYLEKILMITLEKDKTTEISETLLISDTQKPEVIFTPLSSIIKENKNLIKAKAMDNQKMGDVSLLIRLKGETNYRTLKMTAPSEGLYEIQIPDTFQEKGALIEYYLNACDAQRNCETSGSSGSPYKLKVISLEPYTEGYVLEVNSKKKKVTLSLGSVDGLTKKDKLIVVRPGKELRDPRTNDLLHKEEIYVGVVEVDEVMPKTSYAYIYDYELPVEMNDRVRKRSSSPIEVEAESGRLLKIILKWSPSPEPEVRGYYIYRSPTITGNYQRLTKITKKDITSFEDTSDIQPASSFYYKVSAFNTYDTEGLMSEPVYGKSRGGPVPPSMLRAISGMPKMIKLQWDKHTDNEVKGYKIYRGEGEAGPFAETAMSDKNEFIDKSLTSGTTYYYTVTAYYLYKGATVEGEQSKAVSAMTKEGPKVPAGLSGENGLPKKAVIKWGKGEGSTLKEYWIYRGDSEKMPAAVYSKVNGNVFTFTDKDLKNNTAYYYAVRAVDTDGLESSLSEVTQVTTKPLPRQPAGIKSQVSEGKVLLNWEANEEKDIKGYNIFKKGGFFGDTKLATVPDKQYEMKLDEKTKALSIYITAVDNDGLESEASEVVEIKVKE